MSLQILPKDILLKIISFVANSIINDFDPEIKKLEYKLDAWDSYEGSNMIAPCEYIDVDCEDSGDDKRCEKYVHKTNDCCYVCKKMYCSIHIHVYQKPGDNFESQCEDEDVKYCDKCISNKKLSDF